MKLYRLNTQDPDEGCCVSWHPSRVEATKARRKNGDGTIEVVDVPTDKAGLLAWLNKNFNRDNG